MKIDINQIISAFQNALGREMNPQAIVMRAIQNTGNNINPMIGNLVKMAQNGQLEQLMTFAQNFMVENNIDPNKLMSQISNNPNSVDVNTLLNNSK